MRIFLIIVLLTCALSSNAQVYSRGGASQLYWDWRPDLASNCYEFTYVNYMKAKLLPPHYDYKIGIFYWDDCNFGKSYVRDSDCVFLHWPLLDTLYRVTTYYGERDTMCGFDSPYDPGTDINFAQKTTPVRTKVVYKGLVYLPEKCNRWYFSVAKPFNSNGIDQYYCTNGSRGGDLTFTNTKSNIDSLTYFMRTSYVIQVHSYFTMPVVCSFDNTDFSNNSSGRFITEVPHYFPVSKAVEFNPGYYDPDHDSTVFSIPDTINSAEGISGSGTGGSCFCPRDTSGNPISKILTHNRYFAPLPGQTGPNPIRYNALNNPFDTDSTFHMVDSTGKMTFNAKSDMEPILYCKATKYRKGKFLSETFIINQFTLINENREPSYMRIDTPTVLNALFNNQGTMMSCTGLPISFDAWVKLPITSGDLIVRTTADSTLPGIGACSITGIHTDSVHLKFSWTPPANARGLYNVFVSAKDTNCSPPFNHYLQVYTWSFYIDSCLSPLNIPNSSSGGEGTILIYPNPTNDKLIITSSESFSSVKIFTLLSELVYEKKIKAAKQLEISIAELPAGMYLVNVDGKWVRKLVVEK